MCIRDRLCAMDKAERFAKKPVRIAGIGQATDTHVVANRAVPTDCLLYTSRCV